MGPNNRWAHRYTYPGPLHFAPSDWKRNASLSLWIFAGFLSLYVYMYVYISFGVYSQSLSPFQENVFMPFQRRFSIALEVGTLSALFCYSFLCLYCKYNDFCKSPFLSCNEVYMNIAVMGLHFCLCFLATQNLEMGFFLSECCGVMGQHFLEYFLSFPFLSY